MTNRPRRASRIATIVLLLYWSGLFLVTHVPLQTGTGGQYNDKLVHFAAYAVLGFLLALAVSLRTQLSYSMLCGLLALTALYGMVDELLQSLVPGRVPDFGDWMADLAGGGVGLVGLLLVRRAASVVWRPGSE